MGHEPRKRTLNRHEPERIGNAASSKLFQQDAFIRFFLWLAANEFANRRLLRAWNSQREKRPQLATPILTIR